MPQSGSQAEVPVRTRSSEAQTLTVTKIRGLHPKKLCHSANQKLETVSQRGCRLCSYYY